MDPHATGGLLPDRAEQVGEVGKVISPPVKKNRHQRRLDAKATRLMRRKLLRQAISAQIRAEMAAARGQKAAAGEAQP